jgi:hypothetical protein
LTVSYWLSVGALQLTWSPENSGASQGVCGGNLEEGYGGEEQSDERWWHSRREWGVLHVVGRPSLIKYSNI